MQVYVAPEVKEVEALHPYLTDAAFRALPIRAQITQQAGVVHTAHAGGDRRARVHIMSWWPGARGRTPDEVMASPFALDDARLTMAREYGFADWAEVEQLGETGVVVAFEDALDAMLAGDADRLGQRLHEDPQLATARSVFGHRATLLHYLGANGVESHRQRTPLNAAALAELLIEHGADVHAEADMYGGGQTPFALASTSAHPYEAGIATDLNRVLQTSPDP